MAELSPLFRVESFEIMNYCTYVYFLVKLLDTKPCSSFLSSCLPVDKNTLICEPYVHDAFTVATEDCVVLCYEQCEICSFTT